METKDLAIGAIVAAGAYLIYTQSQGGADTVPGAGGGGAGYSLDFSGLSSMFAQQSTQNAAMLSGYISAARGSGSTILTGGGEDYSGIFGMLLDRAKKAEETLAEKVADPFGLNASYDPAEMLKKFLKGTTDGLKLPEQLSSTEDAGFLGSNKWPQASSAFGKNIGTSLAVLPAGIVEGGRTGLGNNPGGRVFSTTASGALAGSVVPGAGTVAGGLLGGGVGILNELVLMFSGGGLGFRSPGGDYLGRPNYGSSAMTPARAPSAPVFSSPVYESPVSMRANYTPAGIPSTRNYTPASSSSLNYTPAVPASQRKWGPIGSSAKGGVIYGWVN